MNESSENIKVKHILFCKCGGARINSDLLHSVDEHLKNLPVCVTSLSDLCGLIPERKVRLNDLFRADGEYLVIGCYSRTMDLLFGQIKEENGNPLVYKHINLIDLSPDQALNQINDFCLNQKGKADYREITDDSGWPSWYPLIDYTRCTACGQCADFCLFGVYEKTENRVSVVNPEACKNNCPACARICPSSAIIFPKYKNGGAVGGSDEIDEYAEQKRQAQDIEQFLGADIYSALEKRKVRRASIVRDEAMKKALSEREDAVKGIFKN